MDELNEHQPAESFGDNMAENLERLLIRVIRRHPVLYNRTHSQHNRALHPAAHETAWRQVSETLRLEESSCKSLWYCLKQKFIKYRKRLSTGEPQPKDWPVYDEMYSWLDEHVQKRISHRSRIEMWGQICSSAAGPVNTDNFADGAHFDDSADNHQMDSVWSELPAEEPIDGSSSNKAQTSYSSGIENKAALVIIKKLAKRKSLADLESEPEQRKQKTENSTEQSRPIRDSSQATTRSDTGVATDSIRARNIASSKDTIEELATDARASTKPVVLNNNVASIYNLAAVFEAPPQVLAPIAPIAAPVSTPVDTDKLENAISKCISMVDKCAQRQRSQDPDDVFGTLIASMVRELPAERRRSARVQILDVVGDLLEKLAGEN